MQCLFFFFFSSLRIQIYTFLSLPFLRLRSTYSFAKAATPFYNLKQVVASLPAVSEECSQLCVPQWTPGEAPAAVITGRQMVGEYLQEQEALMESWMMLQVTEKLTETPTGV